MGWGGVWAANADFERSNLGKKENAPEENVSEYSRETKAFYFRHTPNRFQLVEKKGFQHSSFETVTSQELSCFRLWKISLFAYTTNERQTTI